MATRQFTALSVEYRDIPNFPGYRVGSDGSVWSCWNKTRGNGYVRQITGRWKQLKLQRHTTGYWSVSLKSVAAKRAKRLLIHRLVLGVFVGPCPENMQCRHRDGVKANNQLTNLVWGTKAENEADRKRHCNYSRNVRLYMYEGRTLPIRQWAAVFGIPYTCFYKRIAASAMTFEEAIAMPYKGRPLNCGKE